MGKFAKQFLKESHQVDEDHTNYRVPANSATHVRMTAAQSKELSRVGNGETHELSSIVTHHKSHFIERQNPDKKYDKGTDHKVAAKRVGDIIHLHDKYKGTHITSIHRDNLPEKDGVNEAAAKSPKAILDAHQGTKVKIHDPNVGTDGSGGWGHGEVGHLTGTATMGHEGTAEVKLASGAKAHVAKHKLSIHNESTQVSEAKLVKTHTDGNRSAKVYKDTEYGEHIVKFHTDGKHHKDADYHTDDEEDAHGTAKHWISQKHESQENIHESVSQYFTEKSEEFSSHRSDHTGTNFHADKANTEKITNMTHGEVADVELVHHDGAKLHVKKYEAHKIHKSVHLYDDDGNHIDSFRHPHYR